jgi:hypothetical protein
MSYNRNAQGYAEGSGAHPSKTAKGGASDSGVVQRVGQPPGNGITLPRCSGGTHLSLFLKLSGTYISITLAINYSRSLALKPIDPTHEQNCL